MSHLTLKLDGSPDILGRYFLSAPLKPHDKLLLELRVQGDRLVGLLDGKVIIETQDTRLQAPGEWGIIADEGWFESVEVQPLPAAVAGIKLWDTPEKLPKQKGVSWEDGSVRLDSGSVDQPTPRSGDCIARVSVRMNPDAERPELWLRKQSAINVGYKVGLNVQDRSVALKKMNTDIETVLMRWQLPRSYTPIEWVNLEFRAVGEELTVSADGAVLGTVRDSSITQPGTMMLYGYAKSYFRNIEYVPLDAPAVSPAPNLPVSKSSDPKFPPGQWVKLFTKPEDLPEELRKPDSGVTWEEGWIRGMKPGQVLPLPKTLAGNYAVRARCVAAANEVGEGVIMRRQEPLDNSQRGHYLAKLSGGKLLVQRMVGGAYQTLQAVSGPDIPSDQKEYMLEAGVVGKRLVSRLNSTFATAQMEDIYTKGHAFRAVLTPIRDIQVINLDGLPEAEALRLLGVDEQGNDLRGKTGAAEAWIDVLRDPSIVTLTKGAEFTPEGLRLPAGSGAYVARGKSLRGDVAMRVRTTFGGARLQLRSRSDGRGFYALTPIDDKTVSIQRYDLAANQGVSLRTFTLTSLLKPGEDYEMEFRCVGPALTASLNGEVLGTITDGTHKEGSCTLSAWETSQTTALAKAFSVLDLSKASPSAASSSPSLPVSKSSPSSIHTFNGHRYQLISTPSTWAEAKTKAEAMGGHLATFTTEAEERWARETILPPLSPQESAAQKSPDKLYWIGGEAAAQSKDFRWLSGEPVGKIGWRSGNPGWRERADMPETKAVGALFAAGLVVERPRANGEWISVQQQSLKRAGFIIELDDTGGAGGGGKAGK